MLQPRLGLWSASTGAPASTASSARAQVCPGHRPVVAGPAVVELPAVDEPTARVEQEEVRRARGAVGLRHLLALVEEVGEDVAERPAPPRASRPGRPPGRRRDRWTRSRRPRARAPAYSRANAANSARMCFTNGQWLQMKATRSARDDPRSPRAQMPRPSKSGRSKGGRARAEREHRGRCPCHVVLPVSDARSAARLRRAAPRRRGGRA